MYDPILGRFASRDPMPENGAPTILSDNNWFGARMTMMRNQYAYVDNNPTNWTDPSGKVPIIPIIIIGGGAVLIKCLCERANQRRDFGATPPTATQQACLNLAAGVFRATGILPSIVACIESGNIYASGIMGPGSDPVTLFSNCPSFQTFIAPTDLRCDNCKDFVDLVAILFHECLHGKGHIEQESIVSCQEWKFNSELLRRFGNIGPCAADPDFSDIVQRKIDESKANCEHAGGEYPQGPIIIR